MGELVSYSIPNLIQGISQQPDALRDPSQGEVQINGMSSLVDGLRKRDCSRALRRVSDASLGDAVFHSILRDQDEQYLVVITTTAIRVFALDGTERAVVAPFGWSYLATVAPSPGTVASRDIRAATIADFTFISNVQRRPAMAASIAPATARPAAHEALVWVKAANYGQTYRLSVNGTTATLQTAVAAVVVSAGSTVENRISTAEIADGLMVALAGVAGVTITRVGSVLHLTSASTITLAASDARANADITAITRSVQAFTDLPTIAPEGYQVEIVGDPGNRFDGYHVQFVPRAGAGTFGEGAWEETVAPGQLYELDAASMPHLLVRLPGGGFYFGPANGSVQDGITLPTWGQRTAGNSVTAPNPSFIGHAIQDVFIHRNRLGLLADENVVLSRSASFFDFFPETVTTVLDSDPIDIAASSARVSTLRYAVPFQDELIIFSDQVQFRFSASETTLTPSSAQITVLTQYEMDVRCRPLQVQGEIVFCQADGQWSRFRAFTVQAAGTALVGNAADLTTNASSFIPSGVRQLAGNDIGNVWVALSDKVGYADRLYVYKYFYRNTGSGAEKAQASWSYWEFGTTNILAALCVRETLYMLSEYPDGVWLEELRLTDRLNDPSPSPYPLLLDRLVSTTTDTPAVVRVASGVYSKTRNTTTWTLPYQIAAPTQAWSGYSESQNGGILLGSASSGNTIVARGDWTQKDIFFGEAYTFFYRFTRFKYYRDAAGGRVAGNVQRSQIRYANIRYSKTPYFRVRVSAERRQSAFYVFDGTVLRSRHSVLGSELNGSSELEVPQLLEGVFRVPILSRGDTAMVDLINDTPHPCAFSGCDWVGVVTSPARSLQ